MDRGSGAVWGAGDEGLRRGGTRWDGITAGQVRRGRMERGRAKARVGSGGVGGDEAVWGGVSYLYRRAVQGGNETS